MIRLILTLDYEIYGNGDGDLYELVYKPAEILRELIARYHWKIVNFVEAAELMKIKQYRSDQSLDLIEAQVEQMHRQGHEIALHLHPQWFEAKFESNKWLLNYDQYNLCTLPADKINTYIQTAIRHLQKIVRDDSFQPIAFRAGNWLLQPTQTISGVLAENGIKIDSSLFKGGRQIYYRLNYNAALKNGYYWKFTGDVTKPESEGLLFEIPIYTKMVPIWKMYSKKRENIYKEIVSHWINRTEKLCRTLDMLRLFYPKKFDFCKLTFGEFKEMLDALILQDEQTPGIFKPIVLIGHTKNLFDFETLERFLDYVVECGIEVSTFKEIYDKKLYRNEG